MRDTINDANSVIETYVKAEQNFKLSMQQRLKNILTEESEK